MERQKRLNKYLYQTWGGYCDIQDNIKKNNIGYYKLPSVIQDDDKFFSSLLLANSIKGYLDVAGTNTINIVPSLLAVMDSSSVISLSINLDCIQTPIDALSKEAKSNKEWVKDIQDILIPITEEEFYDLSLTNRLYTVDYTKDPQVFYFYDFKVSGDTFWKDLKLESFSFNDSNFYYNDKKISIKNIDGTKVTGDTVIVPGCLYRFEEIDA